MNPITILEVVNVFFAGILAGMEFVIHYGLRAPAEVLDERAQLQLRQAMVLRLRVLVPAFFVPTAVSGIAVTIIDGATPGLWLRCVAVLAVLSLDLDQGRRHCSDQQRHAYLAARRATKELESTRQPCGAVP